MARLEDLFEPELKKSTPNPVRDKHEILEQAAERSGVCNFFLPPAQGDLLYKVLNWNLGDGSSAFLQRQQRAPYSLRFLPNESALWHDTFLVTTSMPISFKQQRNP